MNFAQKNRVSSAIEKRIQLGFTENSQTDAYRLVNSAGDGLPGITVDRFGESVLVEQHSKSASPEDLIRILVDRYPKGTPVFLKRRWSPTREGRTGTQVSGIPANPNFQVVENGLRFHVKLCDEEHVGIFLDTRPARQAVRQVASGKRVLNLFSYTGGFGLAAAAGGARSTSNVDNKKSACTIAKTNYQLSQLPFDTRTFLKGDALEFLSRAKRGSGRYDLVIVDPPPRFQQKKRRDFEALKDYGRLLSKCVPILAPGAQILAGLNALTVKDEQFDRLISQGSDLAGVAIERLETIGPGLDFPPAIDRPEARFVFLAVGS